MNHSQLAPRANPGGALPQRNSACIENFGRFARLTRSKIGAPLRKLMMIGFCVFTTTHAFGAPSVTLEWDANAEPDIARYELSYGTSSGVYSSTVDAGLDTIVDVGGLTEGKTYYFVVCAYSAGGIKSLPSSQVSYTVPLSDTPPKNEFTLHFVDSEDPNGYPAVYAFDGNPNTFWHTEWRTNAPPPPHELQIDLGSIQNLRGFRYLPRQDAYDSGNINQYQFYISIDGANWEAAVASGNFPNTKGEKEVLFNTKSGRYVKLVALSEVNGSQVTNVAELTFLQATSPPNTAPFSIAQTLSAAEDTPLDISLAGTDAEGATLIYSVVAPPRNGTLTGNAPNLTYLPTKNFGGDDSFTFQVNDGTLISATATVAITVTAVNDAPVATANSVTTVEDTSLPITLGGTDPEAGSLTFAVVAAPAHGKLTGTAPNLSYSPADNYKGADSFTFRVNDGTVNSATATVSITVTAANDPPVAIAKAVITAEDTSLPISLTGTDPDGDSLTFAVVAAPAHGKLTGTAPNLTYSPAANYTGADQFTFRVNDGTVNSAIATVFITVTAVNSLPVFIVNLIPFTATKDQSFTGQLRAFDADPGDVLTFQKVGGPAWLNISADGKLDGTPLHADVGTASFIVKASDRSNASATATLNITVANTNDAPVFTIKPLVFPAGTEKEPYLQSLANTATDSDPSDTVTYSRVDGPAWLVIDKSGALSGTPPDGSVGTNLFTIRATDAAGAFEEATLQIKININDLPLPWSLDRVGTSNLAGAGKFSSGTFMVAGAGLLADKQDSGTFVWQTLTGDGNITTRISKIRNPRNGTRVGVVIRESLAANSRQTHMGIDARGKYQWLRRSSTGGRIYKTTKLGSATDNVWLRLVRKGNTITAYRSTNSTSWTKMGSSSVKMSKNCYIGLWVSSGGDALLNTSLFDKVEVTP